MHRYITALFAAALCGLIGYGISSSVLATEETPRMFDRSIARVTSDVSWVDVSAADYTSYQTLVTIAPEDGHALNDVRVVVDLDFETGNVNGFAGGYTSETAVFALQRKVWGNWRTDEQSDTTAIDGDSSDSVCLSLPAGLVGPTEQLRVVVKLSAEQTDIKIPFSVYYRSGAAATLTTVSN